MRKFLGMIALFAMMVAMPAVSDAQTRQSFMSPDTAGSVTSVSFSDELKNAQNMPVAQAGAIIGGGVLGMVLADMFLDGGMFTVVGVLAGAVLGNTWYSQGHWPL